MGGNEWGNSAIPTMWDQISTDISQFNYVPTGQNILYLDGHVAFEVYDKGSTAFPTSPLYAAVHGGLQETTKNYCE